MTRTLWDAVGEVPDGRGRKGRQIPLQAILALSVAAMLARADSLIAIFRFGRRLRPQALKILGFVGGTAPCHASYHYVFHSIDGDALSRVLGKFALGDAEPGHMAMDGKTLRGSRRLDAPIRSGRCMFCRHFRLACRPLSAISWWSPIRTKSLRRWCY